MLLFSLIFLICEMGMLGAPVAKPLFRPGFLCLDACKGPPGMLSLLSRAATGPRTDSGHLGALSPLHPSSRRCSPYLRTLLPRGHSRPAGGKGAGAVRVARGVLLRPSRRTGRSLWAEPPTWPATGRPSRPHRDAAAATPASTPALRLCSRQHRGHAPPHTCSGGFGETGRAAAWLPLCLRSCGERCLGTWRPVLCRRAFQRGLTLPNGPRR